MRARLSRQPRATIETRVAFAAVAAIVVLTHGCAARAGIPLTTDEGSRSLVALSPAAKSCVLADGDTAWFAANGPIAPVSPSSIEIVVSLEGASSSELFLSPVYARDVDRDGRLSRDMSPRPAARVTTLSAAETLSLSLELPAGSGDEAAIGFAVGVVAVGDETRARILSASLKAVETGWDRSVPSRWVGFSSGGGTVNAASLESDPPAVPLPDGDSIIRLSFLPVPREALGVPTRPSRATFRSASGSFGFRASPVPHVAFVPSRLVSGSGALSAVSGTERLASLRVSRGASVPADRPADPASLISADPHLILEWPLSLWRDARREVFSWDRFPSIVIFDTADYRVQDLYFKRLAFFTEKKGFRGRLADDAEIASLHGFNAHDYRAESLAAFFELARVENFPLGAEERELLDILLDRGIVVRDGRKYAPGTGAVLSVSRESVAYLRHMFMTHECFHGAYFVDADFRATVTDVYARMDPTAVEFLQGYFTIAPGLEYDTDDGYLMENEFMAYMLQQPVARVGDYFTRILLERYLRHGGSREVGEYIARTGASDFVKAAESLEAYCFDRWGFSAGRVGLWFSSGSGD